MSVRRCMRHLRDASEMHQDRPWFISSAPTLELWSDYDRQTTTSIAILWLILFLVSASNHFLFAAFVTMIYWTSTGALLNLVAPLDSMCLLLTISKSMFFWTSGFDSTSILFDSLSVIRMLPNCISYTRFRCFSLSKPTYGSFLWFH